MTKPGCSEGIPNWRGWSFESFNVKSTTFPWILINEKNEIFIKWNIYDE